MNLKVMPKSSFPDWIKHLSDSSDSSAVDQRRLIAPTPSGEQYIFAEVQSAEEIVLNYPSSILPPKKALLPQKEYLFSFNLEDERETVSLEEASRRQTVILGVHTCDLHAIQLLDNVFIKGESAVSTNTPQYTDQHYLRRRQNTTLVSIECLKPCSEYSFCRDMRTSSVPEHFDLHLTDLGEAYAISIGSTKGAELLAGFAGILPAHEKDLRRIDQVMGEKWASFPYRLQADISELPGLLKTSYKSPLWQELGERCLGCGLCTLVCPTCYCFDVQDEIDLSLNAGKRYRVWDSCQLTQFAAVAGGHNFRPGRGNRLRHHFLRKYQYQSISPGQVGCVGCGRCIQACLVKISPVEVLNKLYQRKIAARHGQKEALIA